MTNDKTEEIHLLTLVGVALAAVSIVIAVFLPGTQTWLCRYGLRPACDVDKMEIKSINFRHQYLPRSADATAWRDVLYNQSPANGSAPQPIDCDDSDDKILTLYEKDYIDSVGKNGLVRGIEDYVMAEVDFSYPSSDIAIEIEFNVTTRAPHPDPKEIWKDFGRGNPPSQQTMRAISPANSGDCKISFLIVPFSGDYGLNTANWPTGNYIVDINLTGGVQAHKRNEFELK